MDTARVTHGAPRRLDDARREEEEHPASRPEIRRARATAPPTYEPRAANIAEEKARPGPNAPTPTPPRALPSRPRARCATRGAGGSARRKAGGASLATASESGSRKDRFELTHAGVLIIRRDGCRQPTHIRPARE
jgi:hypothetical protein